MLGRPARELTRSVPTQSLPPDRSAKTNDLRITRALATTPATPQQSRQHALDMVTLTAPTDNRYQTLSPGSESAKRHHCSLPSRRYVRGVSESTPSADIARPALNRLEIALGGNHLDGQASRARGERVVQCVEPRAHLAPIAARYSANASTSYRNAATAPGSPSAPAHMCNHGAHRTPRSAGADDPRHECPWQDDWTRVQVDSVGRNRGRTARMHVPHVPKVIVQYTCVHPNNGRPSRCAARSPRNEVADPAEGLIVNVVSGGILG